MDVQKKALFFLKFGKRENLESLQMGNLYMKNFKYFIELENITKKKGMGDAWEASLVLSKVTCTIKHPETDETLFVFDASRSVLRDDDVLSKPVFCMFVLGLDDLEVTSDNGDVIEANIGFTEQQKEEMKGEFGNDVLVIPVDKFMEKLNANFKKEHFEYASGMIEYTDFGINFTHRLLSFENSDPKLYFYKDKQLEYQKEFRVVILNKDVEDFFTTNIGDMTSFTSIVPAEKLLNGDYKISLNIKK